MTASALLSAAPAAKVDRAQLGLAAPATTLRRSLQRDGRASQTDWLSEINRYREATGLPAVINDPAWDVGIDHHLTYLEKTPPRYETGKYASFHTENPSSPYYTADGAEEAASSDLAPGGATTPVGAIDEWLSAPFHAIGMLRAGLTRVALGIDSRGYAGLDVIRGLDGDTTRTSPILFPGPGITTDLLEYGGEEPSPLQTCDWSTGGVGLPLIVLLPDTPSAGAAATLEGPGGDESSASGTLCIVDQYTYHSSDPIYGPTGLDILEGDSAVLIIPRRALAEGKYTASLNEPGEAPIVWSFAATVPAPVAQARPRIVGPDRVGSLLTVEPGSWSNRPTSYHEQWMRCRTGACTQITGATRRTYHLISSDIGARIRVVETARNAGGTGAPDWSRSTHGIRPRAR